MTLTLCGWKPVKDSRQRRNMLPRISDFTIPMIEERIGNTIRVYDIFSLLNKERIVMIGTPIMDYTAAVVVAQLIYLEKNDPKKPIWMYINSPGGDITSGLAIRDTMRFVKCPIHTIGFGQCA